MERDEERLTFTVNDTRTQKMKRGMIRPSVPSQTSFRRHRYCPSAPS